MWACGHITTSTPGAKRLINEGVFRTIVELAETCPVYSLRGTAVYVLGLMGTTYIGANELFNLGWMCVRHGRHERWPVVEEEDWSGLSTHQMSEVEEDGGTTASSSDAVPNWPTENWEDSDAQISVIGRSSTLPVGQQPPTTISHKRSLSETQQQQQETLQEQTQEQVLQQQDLRHLFLPPRPSRHRDNSYTESTTSAVSSCDSALGQTRQQYTTNNGSTNNTTRYDYFLINSKNLRSKK